MTRGAAFKNQTLLSAALAAGLAFFPACMTVEYERHIGFQPREEYAKKQTRTRDSSAASDVSFLADVRDVPVGIKLSAGAQIIPEWRTDIISFSPIPFLPLPIVPWPPGLITVLTGYPRTAAEKEKVKIVLTSLTGNASTASEREHVYVLKPANMALQIGRKRFAPIRPVGSMPSGQSTAWQSNDCVVSSLDEFVIKPQKCASASIELSFDRSLAQLGHAALDLGEVQIDGKPTTVPPVQIRQRGTWNIGAIGFNSE